MEVVKNMLGNVYALDTAYHLFFLAIVIDFISGVLVAGKFGKLRSRSCSDGLFRSVGELLILSILVIVNRLSPQVEIMVTALAYGFLFKEGLSICENLIKLDVYIPSVVKRMLEVGVENLDKLDKGGK